MGFEEALKKYFDRVNKETDFVERIYETLNKFGFNADNTIACVGVCRDELSQSLIEEVNKRWGYAFNLSGLAGMFFAGKTGLKAVIEHSPIVDGKERYVFYALPHIAIDGEGRIGICRRVGREGKSTACGALAAFQKELSSIFNLQPLTFNIDIDDIEYSLIKMRLLRELKNIQSSKKAPDLLELTRLTQKVIQKDLEHALNTIIDKGRSDYAMMTGIQIHGYDGNYVSPAECYAVVEGIRHVLKV